MTLCLDVNAQILGEKNSSNQIFNFMLTYLSKTNHFVDMCIITKMPYILPGKAVPTFLSTLIGKARIKIISCTCFLVKISFL